ncbi:heterokaryon incompatibility protein [Diaporthe amygdali]|uniref:heterokaryon incompatibility protein n=1 Tax=Phomopsis amygdali TaxID=1214568 RepID=UPI0022FE51D0|nr:heterokaryon incompatibility protein [Diaporthe amygdali]KAJ0122042.1 heterokaryon incompatibility protein [Diaporthe amygdali]
MLKQRNDSREGWYPRTIDWVERARYVDPGSLYLHSAQDISCYSPLESDEIRTLVIEAGQGDEQLRGSLERHKLGDLDRPYTALSYVWGSPKRNAVLHLGDDGKRVKITENAEALLRNLRRPDESRRVWIDGVCINQDDLTERSHQVSLMHAIYSGASNVLVWLGESDKHTRSVFEFFKIMHERYDSGKACEKQAEDLSSCPEGDSAESTKASGEAPQSPDLDEHKQDDFARIQAFTGRPWFSRAWTFQEACLSPDTIIRCGTHELAWQVFVSATLYLVSRGMARVLGSTSDTIVALAHFAAASSSRQVPYLSVILPLTRNLQSTDGRDKEGGFSVLSSVDGPARDTSLPSWAPDWRIPRRTALLHGYDWPSPTHRYEINKGAPFENKIPDDVGSDPLILVVKAARIDKVVRVCNPKPLLDYIAKAPVPTSTAAVDPGQLGLATYYGQTRSDDYVGNIAQALLKTLTADRGGVGEEGMGTWVDEEHLVGMSMFVPNYRWWSSGLDGGSSATPTEPEIAIKRLITAMYTFLNGRVIFKTENRLIGIVSSGAQVGDEVWNLVGGYTPFVLRQKDTSKKRWALVGETYVHGIMRGGLWKPEIEVKEELAWLPPELSYIRLDDLAAVPYTFPPVQRTEEIESTGPNLSIGRKGRDQRQARDEITLNSIRGTSHGYEGLGQIFRLVKEC